MNLTAYINRVFERIERNFLFTYEKHSYMHRQKALILFITEIIGIVIFSVSLFLHGGNSRLHDDLLYYVDIFLVVSVLISMSFLFSGRYKMATVSVLIAIVSAWSFSFFFSSVDYLSTGSSSYLFFMYAIVVLEGLLGKKRSLVMATVFFIGLNICFYVRATLSSTAHVQDEIFHNAVNAGISLLIVFVITFLYSVVTEKALRTAEKEIYINRELNRNLETKVAKRTEEIESAYDELESMNRNLLSVNNDLETAHDTIRNDIKMAQNIQMKFLPDSPPVSELWDVAYEFRPISGVSGDIYDFYVFGDSFCGLMLCDVSGHGVSSGLLTILAKSIIFRSFSDFHKKGIEKVVDNANLYLIEEFDRTRNYLTGVFLSFCAERVEYVNAAHPDIVKRDARTGKSSIISYENNEKGFFLGMKGMEGPYRKLDVELSEEDSLLIFSDALLETRDPDNLQYGYERILCSLDNCSSDMSAREILDSIMHDFYYETGDNLRDDLTFIVLKKK